MPGMPFYTADWNTEQDINAAAKICETWPSPVVFSPYETGAPIITGRNFGTMRSDHPVRIAYRLFNNGDERAGRNSWDPSPLLNIYTSCGERAV